MTLKSIGAFILELISGWKNPTNVDADVADLLLLLNGATLAFGTSPFLLAAKKFAGESAAGLANLEAGQAATVAKADGYSLVLVKDGGAAATSLGL